MRKYHDVLQVNAPRTRRSRVPRAITLGLCLLVSPLLYEGGKVVVGRWASMAGVHREPETPLLDMISAWSSDANGQFWRYSSALTNGSTWRASTAVPLAVG